MEAQTPPPRRILTVKGERSILVEPVPLALPLDTLDFGRGDLVVDAPGGADWTFGRDTDTAHLLMQLEAARIALRRTFEDVMATTAGAEPAPA